MIIFRLLNALMVFSSSLTLESGSEFHDKPSSIVNNPVDENSNDDIKNSPQSYKIPVSLSSVNIDHTSSENKINLEQHPDDHELETTISKSGQDNNNQFSSNQITENQEEDYSAIPGEPNVDYPVYSEIPKTSFDCKEQEYQGYYADVEARCQVFHICTPTKMFDFLCPNGTIFSQQNLTCVWWDQFDCQSAPELYSINANLFISPNVVIDSYLHPALRQFQGISNNPANISFYFIFPSVYRNLLGFNANHNMVPLNSLNLGAMSLTPTSLQIIQNQLTNLVCLRFYSHLFNQLSLVSKLQNAMRNRIGLNAYSSSLRTVTGVLPSSSFGYNSLARFNIYKPSTYSYPHFIGSNGIY